MLAPKHWVLGAFGVLALLTLVFVLGGRMVTSFSGLSLMDPQNCSNQRSSLNLRHKVLHSLCRGQGRKKLLFFPDCCCPSLAGIKAYF